MVAGGLARDAVAKAHRDDVLAPGLFDVRGQDTAGLVLHGAADPVLVQDADDLFAVLRGDVVGVALSDGEFVDVGQIELLGRLELGMEIRAAVAVGGRADDQLVLHDEGGHMLEDIADHLGPEHRSGVAGKALVGLGLQDQPFGGDAGTRGEIFLSHSANSVGHGNLLSTFPWVFSLWGRGRNGTGGRDLPQTGRDPARPSSRQYGQSPQPSAWRPYPAGGARRPAAPG